MRHANSKYKEPKLAIRNVNTKKVASLELSDIQPLTISQARAFKEYKNGKQICMTGCPGTGKSFCAVYLALQSLFAKEIDKIIIIRSAKATVDIGFLPGDEKEKLAVYETPYVDIVNDIFERDDAYSILKTNGQIEFTSTSFLRGLTFDNCVIILDEFQNSSITECHTVTTRVGENTRLIVMGDDFQKDFFKHDVSGFETYVRILKSLSEISVIEFGIHDVVRSGFVKSYLMAIAA